MYFNITNKINLLLLSTILLCCNVSYCSNNNHNEQNEQLNCSSNTNPNVGVPLCAISQPNSPYYSPSYYVPGNDLSEDSSDTFSNVRSLTSYCILQQISDNHLSNDISQQTSGGSSHHFPSNISNNIDSNNSNYNNDNSLQNLQTKNPIYYFNKNHKNTIEQLTNIINNCENKNNYTINLIKSTISKLEDINKNVNNEYNSKILDDNKNKDYIINQSNEYIEGLYKTNKSLNNNKTLSIDKCRITKSDILPKIINNTKEIIDNLKNNIS